MADDFRVRVIAETQEAEKRLKQVDAAVEKVVKPRKLNIDIKALNRNFASLQNDVKAASNNIRTFYSVSKNIPGIGDRVKEFENLAKNTAATAKEQFNLGASLKESAKAGNILANSLGMVAGKAGQVIDVLAKIGFATFALKEAVGVLQSAWNGFFNNTIGREIQLRETILKTQTTLASTNKVFANGKEITDPYQKIVALTGAVAERIDSIRERSIALAGVTSNEVIEVFGIVASQVGQIGGGLKEAEDLAINFAAALGTFGIPLYQAQQEIGSILRGQITEDSRLAISLGIRNEDIVKAKSQIGGVTKFLEDRLAAAVAGQRIAAEGFAGVVSNIADLGELIGQNFGRGLLDPLLSGLTAVFESLFRIRTQLFDIASGAGAAIGRAGQLIVGLTAGRTGLGAGDPSKAAAAAAAVAQKGFSELEQVAQRTVGALSQAIEALKPTALILVDAFKNIAEAFVRIKVGTFEALASALANIASVVGALAPALATVFNIYARFLNTPAVRYFSEVAAVLGLLKRVGLDAVTQLALFGRFIFGSVIPAVGGLGTALGGLVAVIAGLILALGKLIVVFAGLATALVGPAAAVPALAAGLRALSVQLLAVGKEATGAGTKLQTMAASFRGLGASAKAAGTSILASLGWVAAIQVGIAVLVDALGRYQRAQENQRSTERAREALRRLQTTYKDVGNEADSATKSARDFELAIVNAEYDRAIRRLDEIKTKLQELRKDAEEFNVIQDFLKLFDVTRTFRRATGRSDFNQRRALVKEEAELRKQLAEVDAARDREQARKDIQLEAQNRVNLEKEITELRRQLDSDLFRQRQALAQKEVEIFRAAGELRIRQIEKANAKLLEGEEGASRAALEALDNYISTRERGDLEIAAAQKTLAIEVGNLEKAISDYRYDIEKKIADLRKKSADYEKNAADARARAGQAPGVTAGFRVGSTGRSTGPHLDIRSPTGDKQAVVNEALAIIKHWQGQGVEYIELSNAKIDVKNMVDEAALRGALLKEQAAHATRAGGGAIDIAVPAGTLVPMPVGTPSWGGVGGWQATSLQTGNIFLHGQQASVASPAAGAAPPAAAATGAASELPDAADAAARYAEAVRSLAGAMERFRSLQAAITEAQTAEAFERIAKAAFPQVAIEQYQDQLAQLQFTYNAVSTNAAAAFDPERTALETARLAQIAISNRELAEIKAGIAAREKLSESERKRAMDSVLQQYKQYLADLERIDKLKRNILATEQITTFIQQSAIRARDIEREIEALQLRNRLQAEGVAPELIQAELAKLEIQREMNRLLEQANGDLEKQAAIRAAAAKQAAAVDALARAQTEPGTRIRSFIGEAERSLKDYEGMAIRVSQSVGDAVGNSLANGITGLIEGTTTAKEIFAGFLKDVGQILIKEGTRMIAMYIAIGIAKQFAGLFGGGADNSKNMATQGINESTLAPMRQYPIIGSAKGNAFAQNGIAAFAKGGTFTNSVVSSPTLFQFADGGTTGAGNIPFQLGAMGEAGPEAIMPLKRGADGSLGVTASIPFMKSPERMAVERSERETVAALNNLKPIDVRVESEVVNRVEYVTLEQHERGMAQTAERGLALTLSALQNSVKARKRVGMA